MLALGAVLVMLPALKLGLGADDLPQRMIALPPNRVPARLYDTGIPLNSGSFSTVLRDYFFGCYREPQRAALARNYGMLPWWTPDSLRLGLWRPVTAFTHWLDYRLFPDSPLLMHAENILWFAAIAFLLAIVYRKLMEGGWAAGLAAVLFLLDGNTYFPVAFIANRGFILSLFLGLMCLYEHHRWRSEKSRFGCVASALFLALSLFANEGGVSTFAFILAYALVLEPGSFHRRALTVLPSVLVIVLWRTIYTCCGFGVFHVGGYIDPSSEPVQFAREVLPRALVLLGGQLTHVAPDLLFAVNPSLHSKVGALYGAAAAAALALFLPCVRRNRMAAFWLGVMVFAAIPAATVAPMGKNLGFVAVGAYGLIASFVAGLVARPDPSSPLRGHGAVSASWPQSRVYRTVAWAGCGLLMVLHVPGAIAGRVLAASGTALALKASNYFADIGNSPDVGTKDVIVVNAPCSLVVAYAPFYKAYRDQPLPESIRMLVPGCTSFEVQRTDAQTLVIASKAPDIFSCDELGPIHGVYACRSANLLIAVPKCRKGDRYNLGSLTAEVLQLDESRLPSRVAFQFDTPLDSPNFRWLRFDWPTLSWKPFQVPAVGQRITISGPLH